MSGSVFVHVVFVEFRLVVAGQDKVAHVLSARFSAFLTALLVSARTLRRW